GGDESAVRSGAFRRRSHFARAQEVLRTMTDKTAEWPGDLTARERSERMIRVDHAGEYGASRIYAGQLAVLGRGRKGDVLRHMAAQEQEHLRTFQALIADRRVRPTVMLPFWH